MLHLNVRPGVAQEACCIHGLSELDEHLKPNTETHADSSVHIILKAISLKAHSNASSKQRLVACSEALGVNLIPKHPESWRS